MANPYFHRRKRSSMLDSPTCSAPTNIVKRHKRETTYSNQQLETTKQPSSSFTSPIQDDCTTHFHDAPKVKSQPTTVDTKKNGILSVVNVRKAELNKNGYKDLVDWLRNPNNIYIGRNMTVYVPGAEGSKWKNPFNVKKYGRLECINMYKDYIKTTPVLYNSLTELCGKNVGCWCNPEPCHGHALRDLVHEHIQLSTNKTPI